MQRIPVMAHARYQHEQRRRHSLCPELWDLLDQVKDPEIPVLSIWDLGILQDIECVDGRVEVTITPTYSGCPAMDTLREDIEALLTAEGITNSRVKLRLSPAWTTDWLSDQGRHHLLAYGIAPPQCITDADGRQLTPEHAIQCPHCDSWNTRRVSEFGSTACKALFQCSDCGEPFDYFKAI